MQEYLQYLDPKVLNKIGNLELKARLIVEGFIAGLHKSPYHGFSVEFAEHREYVPGDDIRYIDWKVYGRSDRYYIKQYEEETNLVVHFLLDCSASMQYQSVEMSKYTYACHIAASLAYLVLQQQDAAGLCLFDKEVVKFLPASSSPSYIKDIVHQMGNVPVQEKSDMKFVLHQAAQQIKKKGLVVIVSDFFDDVSNILSGIRHLRHRKHDVILFHILDPDEAEFSLSRLTQFEGLEDIDVRLLVDPRSIRNAYLAELESYLKEIKSGCLENHIDYVQILTNQSLDHALTAYLATRASKIRGF